MEEENIGKIPYYAKIYRPKEKELINDLWGVPTRKIFEIPLELYTQYEKEKLIEFYEYCINKQYIFPKENKSGKFFYANIIRQLQGSNFDFEKSLNDLDKEISFKNEKLPVEINDDFKKILNSGFLYVHGRDKFYRPLIVLNPGLFTSIDFPTEIWDKFGFFLLEFLVQKFLVPSRVENWNIIVDFGQLSMSNLPYKLKDVFSTFKGIYRCRLFKVYLLNMNFVFSLVWNVVKMIMGANIEAKACKVDSNDGSYDALFQLINRSQVEKKYGGTSEDLKPGEYYPPKFVSDNYFCAESNVKEEGNDDKKDEKESINNKNIDSFQDYDSNMIFYEARSD